MLKEKKKLPRNKKEDDIFQRNTREMKEIGNTRLKTRKRNREREGEIVSNLLFCKCLSTQSNICK